MAQQSVLPHFQELFRSDMQVRLDDSLWQQRPRCYLFPFATGQERSAGPLFRAVSTEDVKAKGPGLVHEPFACLLRRFHDHVHSLSIASEIAKIDNHFSSDGMTLNAQE